MKIPPEVAGHLITILLSAQMRGWIDLKGIEPLLKVVVDSGNASHVRRLLGELLEMLEQVERAS